MSLENSIFSGLPGKTNRRFPKKIPEVRQGIKTPDTSFQFGENNIEKLLLQQENKIYNQFSVKDGSESQPFIETKIVDKNKRQRKDESRSFPIRSQLLQAKRTSKFLISSDGRKFSLKQFFLQSLNPTLETKVWNPLSVVFSEPFVHINRHLSLASAAKLSNVLTLGRFSNTLTSVVDIKDYSQAISKIPFQLENISRIKFQSPYAFNINNEKPGFQIANFGRNIIASKRTFTHHNPNRYMFPISADGGGLPLSSLMSPREEMEQKIGLANAAVKFTKATGFNKENMLDQNTPNIKSVLTGILRALIPEPVRKPLSRILGLLKVSEFSRSNIKIFNDYNPTFSYLESSLVGEGEILSPKIRGVNDSRDKKINFENNDSPLTDILNSIENIGILKASKKVPHTFKTNSQLKNRIKTIQDNRVKNYLQSYGETSAKSKRGSGRLFRGGNTKRYEEKKLKEDRVLYKTYGFANAGVANKNSRFHDRINALDVGEDYPRNITDLVPFKFFHINEKRFIIFRAILSSINESITPNWNEKVYVGRADPVFTYTGATRKLSFDFSIHPESAKELAPLWRKINALIGLCYPNYVELVGGGEYMVAPFVRLTIGDIYKDTPGVLESVTVTVDDAGTWETKQGVDENGNLLSRLPRLIRLSISYAIIGNEQFSSTAKFYDYSF